jgi:hypothetical protein
MRPLYCCVTLMLASLPLSPSFGLSPKGDIPAQKSGAPSAQSMQALLLPLNQSWQPVGPLQVISPRYGALTGRVTSVAIDPSDASGNHVYIGTTGGGVWKSANAAATDASTVTFAPLLDMPAAFAGVNVTSISMGAVSVQPGGTGVVLAGTGDPNDAMDSYYGAGILRSADGGTTWTLIPQSSDGFFGTGAANFSFTGEAFAGFAWSSLTPGLVVAAVTHSLDGTVNNVGSQQVSETGLYYSTDAGQTWFMATIQDGSAQIVQSPATILSGPAGGNPATAVVWNPVRQIFLAAVRAHGYYQSVDGVTWTRLAQQPGVNLTATNCPANPGNMGSASCPIERGVLAVQAATGDTYALTVDANDLDQGLWRDVCNAGMSGCANPTVQFAQQIPDAPLESATGDGTIPQGTYDLTLAALPVQGDTLLFAGTQDLYRCSLAAGCVWRNTTNTATCASAQVAPAQHAMDALSPPAGQTEPLQFFGNDGGLWRSTDGVNQTGPICSSSDATPFQNLNGGLGSLSETTGMASSAADANTLLASFGVAGTAAASTAANVAYGQLLPALGGQVAIDPTNPSNWYAAMGPGVAIGLCTAGVNCTPADFGSQPEIGPAQTAQDESLRNAPYMLDPQDSANVLVGTCRVWRGSASDGAAWSSANAISPMLDGHTQPSCNGNALIRSLAAGGANEQGLSAQNDGSQVLYAGMAGLLDGGGTVAGHVLMTQSANTANSTTPWVDVSSSPVVNDTSNGGIFNPMQFDVSSLYADPHDATGMTVYAAIQGYSVPHLYLSTDGGAHWTNITQNLPDLPLNAVLVDPGNASVVYAASDGGVFVAENVSLCAQSGQQCWNALGTGLPLSPAVALSAGMVSGSGYLRVGTYGRGVWQIPLLSSQPQAAMTLTPTALNFGSQAEQTSSAAQTVTVTNTSAVTLTIGSISASGDYSETEDCVGGIAPGGSCQIQVTFSPTATGVLTGVLTVAANVPGGQQTVSLTGTGTAPLSIVLEPTSISFAGQVVGTVSAAQQVTVSNTSGAPVQLLGESVTGNFSIAVNSCGTSLPAQTGCTLAIDFAPVQAGLASGVLTVTTAQGTQTVPLSGTGETAATDTLSPLSLSFAPTFEFTASAPQTVTLTNSGGAPLTAIQVQVSGDFTVVNGCNYTLNANSACTLTVTYTPHADGPETGTLTVTDINRTQTVALSGTGVAPPTDTLSATSITFPATVVGHTAPAQMLTMTNSGDVALTGISIQALGAGFTGTNTCGATLAAHSSCTITVTYAPQAAGNSTGQLDVADATRTQVVQLSGYAEAPAEDNLSPLSLSFAAEAIGSVSEAQVITLSNNLSNTLTGIVIQSSSGQFPLTTTCGATLAPGNACTISVSFAPLGTGAQTAVITVTDASRTQTVPVTGTGILGGVALAPATVDFGSEGVQIATAPQTIVLANGGTGALALQSVTVTGPFTESTNCGLSLGAGTSCNLQVIFTPVHAGAAAGALTVVTANAGTLQVALSGVGIDFTLSPESSTSATVSSGATAVYQLLLTPAAGSAGTASFACANLPLDLSCTFQPTTASLTAPGLIAVSVNTSASASASARTHVLRGELTAGGLGLLLPGLATLAALGWMQRRGKDLRARALRDGLWLGLLLALLSHTLACGVGGGVLSGGSGAPDPLPVSTNAPSGTYTLTATASAGGLTKSVTLTLTVQ